MIVADKEASIEKANEISHKLLSLITDEAKDFKCEDDPAENIYLVIHTVGSLMSKVAIALQGYGEIYGIEKLLPETSIEWISAISREHINANTGLKK